jgi:cell fate (sporulation/competence/biofilm development) regulator YlbF (YheA/YmcA/DUF963 family)
MSLKNLPGDLPDDYAKLKDLVDQAVHRAIELAESAQRFEFFQALRDLIQEKDLAGDQIAVDTLNWACEQIASRIPLD